GGPGSARSGWSICLVLQPHGNPDTHQLRLSHFPGSRQWDGPSGFVDEKLIFLPSPRPRSFGGPHATRAPASLLQSTARSTDGLAAIGVSRYGSAGNEARQGMENDIVLEGLTTLDGHLSPDTEVELYHDGVRLRHRPSGVTACVETCQTPDWGRRVLVRG